MNMPHCSIHYILHSIFISSFTSTGLDAVTQQERLPMCRLIGAGSVFIMPWILDYTWSDTFIITRNGLVSSQCTVRWFATILFGDYIGSDTHDQ